MLRQNQRNFWLSSTHATEEGVGRPVDNEWIDRFPPEIEVHDVEVKRKGRNTGWESVKVIYRGQRAKDDSDGPLAIGGSGSAFPEVSRRRKS